MIWSRNATASKHMFSDLTPIAGCGNLNKYFTENNYNLLLLLIIAFSLGNKCSSEQQRLPALAWIHPSVTVLGHMVIPSFPALTSCTRQRRLNTMHTGKIQNGMRRLKPSTKRRFWASITCYFMTQITE